MKRTRRKELLDVFERVLDAERCQQLDVSRTMEADYMRSILKGCAQSDVVTVASSSAA